MLERRQKRSEDQQVALQFLLEALADRSEAHAVALVRGDGHIVAGVGKPEHLRGLGSIAARVARGEDCPELDAVTGDSDVFSRAVKTSGGEAYIAALGMRLRRFQDTIDGFARITAS